jgi:hypothetical protein
MSDERQHVNESPPKPRIPHSAETVRRPAESEPGESGPGERYPPVRRDDSVEPIAESTSQARTFDPSADARTPAGPADQDPAEGKRD